MLFLLALFFICIAHIFRVLRWELFISTYEKPNKAMLCRSLSAAYLFNAFLPLKLGDLLRAHLSGKRMKNGRGFSLATIIIERYLDIIVVGLVFAVLCVLNSEGYSYSSLYFYVIAASSLLVLSVVAAVFRGAVKKIVIYIAAFFNVKIEFLLLRFWWSLICGFKDVLTRIDRKRLILHTCVMWLLYLVSYYCFAEFLHSAGAEVTWQNIFYMLFAENSLYLGNLSTLSTAIGIDKSALFGAAYIIIPSLFLLAISYFYKTDDGNSQDDAETYLNLLPHLDVQERLNFLEMYFNGNNREYIENYLSLNRNIEIIQDFSAGSKATTMLCKRGDEYFFRKYAFGSDGEKLWDQIEWLRKYSTILPLTQILRFEHKDSYCYYDMPYTSDTATMFEYAHSMPIDSTWDILHGMLCLLESSLYKTDSRAADAESVSKYIRTKLDDNIDKIFAASEELRDLPKFERLIINGKEYKNLPALIPYLSSDKLTEIFSEDKYSAIHGDLTIENIICSLHGEHYIIDPNTSNVHDSPLLDYAKLLQSLHGGYEFLMAQQECRVEGNAVSFPFMRSNAYHELYVRLDNYLCTHFSEREVKSIYYHEIIHWLRLMPYKIQKNTDTAPIFYAGMIMIANDIIERFDCNEN